MSAHIYIDALRSLCRRAGIDLAMDLGEDLDLVLRACTIADTEAFTDARTRYPVPLAPIAPAQPVEVTCTTGLADKTSFVNQHLDLA